MKNHFYALGVIASFAYVFSLIPVGFRKAAPYLIMAFDYIANHEQLLWFSIVFTLCSVLYMVIAVLDWDH
ncbi:hypothetical protein [Pseudogulbenkiania sp. NH8B]|uniref:hypothetical protein n=1 Tax=Pseudogulbenkiania sp. (strain NH8B) TaxID=748280 RepID=UPI0011D2111C|nr:hypothetical protein [Pseudogulbenkiania sp. NH8B]